MKYSEVEFGRPFFILHSNPKKQDITVWRKDDAHEGKPYGPSPVLRIFFHGEDFWCNPPTDTNMEYRAIQMIEKYGIAYLTNPDEYFEGWKNCAWNEGDAYRQAYAKEFFEKLANSKKEGA